MSDKTIHLVIVTGMSGAGKTVAIQSFEDLGYFTIDNMPPALVPKFIEFPVNLTGLVAPSGPIFCAKIGFLL